MSTARGESASAVRAAALELVARHGDWKRIGPVRSRVARVGAFALWHWTPFGCGVRSAAEARRLAAEMLGWGVTLPEEHLYGLEIWWAVTGKVASLEWDAEEAPVERLYVKGPWQGDLVRLARREAGAGGAASDAGAG